MWRGASHVTGYPIRYTDRLSKHPTFVESPKYGLLIQFTWEKYLGGGDWEGRKPIQFPVRFLAMKDSEWMAELRVRFEAHKARMDARTLAREAAEAAAVLQAEEEARLRAEAKEWETFKALQAKFDPYAT